MENNLLETVASANRTTIRALEEMLRNSQATNKMSERHQFPQLVSVTRISKLPIVETSWHIANDIYSRIKKSNSLVGWGLDTAESSVQAALEHTLPAVVVLEKPIALIDSLLCKSLDLVEERVPVVTLPPELIYENTKGYVASTIVQPVLKRAGSVKQFGLNQANSAVMRFDNALSVADKYVDQYLPGTSPEENHEVNNLADKNNKALQTIHRVDRFSRKLQRRLTQHTVAEIKAFRHYSEDALRFVLYTAELLAKDPKALKEKAAALWEELSKDEPENQTRPENLEQLTVMVTRELARRVVHMVNYSRAGLATLPHTISQSLHLAADYCNQLADTIFKTAHLDGAKDVAIAQARTQVNKIQAILKEINSYTSQLLDKIARQIAGQYEAAKRETSNIVHNNGRHSGSNNLNAVD